MADVAPAAAAPEGIAATLTAFGFNAQARNAILGTGIEDVDELVDVNPKELVQLFYDACKDCEA